MNKNVWKMIGRAYKEAFAYQANAYLVNRGGSKATSGESVD